MLLENSQFSDLILLPNGNGLLKGTPEHGQKLVFLNQENDLSVMLQELEVAFTNKKAKINELIDTIRFEYQGIKYRAAYLTDNEGSKTWFLRRLGNKVLHVNELNIHPYVAEWLLKPEQSQGLLLISGGQSAGKTWTAASIVKSRLEKFGGHAVTFENPVELPIAGPYGAGYCFQTEILGEHKLGEHIEKAHRYAAPNIVLIGEIRSKYAATEALRMALGSNKQLVIATIHGLDIITALDRLMTWATELDGDVARHNLENALLGVIHQEISAKEGSLILRCPEILTLTFSQQSRGIRSKLRDGTFNGLRDDIISIRQKIIRAGYVAL